MHVYKICAASIESVDYGSARFLTVTVISSPILSVPSGQSILSFLASSETSTADIDPEFIAETRNVRSEVDGPSTFSSFFSGSQILLGQQEDSSKVGTLSPQSA